MKDAFAEYCKKLRGFSYWNKNTKSDLAVEKVLSQVEFADLKKQLKKEIKEELKTGGNYIQDGGQGFSGGNDWTRGGQGG